MTGLLALLSGKKAYLIAIALVVYEVLGYVLGQQDSVNVKTVLEGLGIAAVRAAIAKGR